MQHEFGKLTRYPEGSIREVLKVSSPLMISYLSGYLMLFIDRLILARFSTEAMNTVATVGLICYIFDYALIGITSVIEVLVGRLNGEKRYHLLGQPVWQAIWLCIFSLGICIPLAWFGGKYLIPSIYQELGEQYYIVSVLSCPFFGVGAAFSAFFIAHGKGYIVTIVVIISNVVNLGLSLLLVFGLWGLPRLGPYGAGIATATAQILQASLLAVVFFNKANRLNYGTAVWRFNAKVLNRLNYGTAVWRFNAKVFKQVIKLGMPNAFSHVLEITAWAVVASMLAVVGNEQVTLFSVGQSLFILFASFSEGLQKGVMAISANFIGAKRYKFIAKNANSASYIHLIFCLSLLGLLVSNPNLIAKIFFTHMDLDLSKMAHNSLWVLLYFTLDGLVWIRTALLMSMQDLTFIMLANAISVGLFAVLPIYIFIVKSSNYLDLTSWQVAWGSALVNLIVFYYRSHKKLQVLISDQNQT